MRSSPYRRSDCSTIVCLLELKSASPRCLFVVCLLAALLLALVTVRNALGVWLRCLGWGPKFRLARSRKGTAQIVWPFHRSIPKRSPTFCRKSREPRRGLWRADVISFLRGLAPNWERKVIRLGGRYAQIQDWCAFVSCTLGYVGWRVCRHQTIANARRRI